MLTLFTLLYMIQVDRLIRRCVISVRTHQDLKHELYQSTTTKNDIRKEKQFTGAAQKNYIQQEEDMSGNSLEQ
jgi:hypothetical protein